jgi:dCMP deaminase
MPHLLKDREQKYPRVVHAEMNTILRMPQNHALRYLRLFTTHFPCANCAGAIIAVSIKEIITQKPSTDMLERWGDSMKITEAMFLETGVRVLYL